MWIVQITDKTYSVKDIITKASYSTLKTAQWKCILIKDKFSEISIAEV